MTPLAVQTLPIIVVVVLVAHHARADLLRRAAQQGHRRPLRRGPPHRRLGNGLALAGDQISAASFLGITGAIALTGFNGFYLVVGLPIAYVLVLLLVAEPLRNLGRYTLADVIATRFEQPRPARLDRARHDDHDRHLHGACSSSAPA